MPDYTPTRQVLPVSRSVETSRLRRSRLLRLASIVALLAAAPLAAVWVTTESKKVTATTPEFAAEFGRVLDLSGDVLIVGAPNEGGLGVGPSWRHQEDGQGQGYASNLHGRVLFPGINPRGWTSWDGLPWFDFLRWTPRD